jgi:hypothetical protein
MLRTLVLLLYLGKPKLEICISIGLVIDMN